MTSNRTAKVTLPSDEQILIEREFDAPAGLVFEAYTTPSLVRRWWAGQRGEVTSCEIDLRVGGAWRFVMLAHGEFEVAFHGEYREIVLNQRLVSTEVFEGAPEAGALTAATFTEDGARTILSVLVTHASTENRDMHLKSGMEAGMNEAFDLLEQVAAGQL